MTPLSSWLLLLTVALPVAGGLAWLCRYMFTARPRCKNCGVEIARGQTVCEACKANAERNPADLRR